MNCLKITQKSIAVVTLDIAVHSIYIGWLVAFLSIQIMNFDVM